MSKPKLFIGSSSDSMDVAVRAQKILNDVAQAHTWKDSPVFGPTINTLSALVSAALYYDFGVFLFTADDSISSHGERTECARDNVLVEYGLFLGAIGPERTYSLIQQLPRKRKVKLPSDLEGVGIPRFSYKSRDDLISSLRPSLLTISEKIADLGVDHYRFNLRKGWSYDFDKQEFRMTLDPLKLSKRAFFLTNRKLLLAIRKKKKGFQSRKIKMSRSGRRTSFPALTLIML